MSAEKAVGFIGIGRLGLPLAARLVDAGYAVVCCSRGRSDELVALGGAVAGDGSPRAVAEIADVVCTCMPSGRELEEIVTGENGLLAAAGTAPVVVELSTATLVEKQRVRDQLAQRGGDLLDCPVSGTPQMAEAGRAVIYSSGDLALHERLSDVLLAMSPSCVYVGELGAATKFKYVANLLAFINVTAAVEAMVLADALGLDMARVAEVISASPGATSGQFTIRAPLIAARNFDSKLVTVDNTVEVLEQIADLAAEVDVGLPLMSVVKALFDDFSAAGEGGSDPAKLFLHLRGGAGPGASA